MTEGHSSVSVRDSRMAGWEVGRGVGVSSRFGVPVGADKAGAASGADSPQARDASTKTAGNVNLKTNLLRSECAFTPLSYP
jgi:hypothetical protein